jgi:hypothetical protein
VSSRASVHPYFRLNLIVIDCACGVFARCYTRVMHSRLLLMMLWLFPCTIAVFADSVAGVRWTPPAGWTVEGARPMRAATYSVAPSAGDAASAECGVYFFGEGQGGSVDANVERWKGQFRDGNDQPAAAKIGTRTSHGLTITTIDVSGIYSGMGGPMVRDHTAAPAYRLLGAIVEAPGGKVFVKFTGPAKTIAANHAKFEQLIASFQPDK